MLYWFFAAKYSFAVPELGLSIGCYFYFSDVLTRVRLCCYCNGGVVGHVTTQSQIVRQLAFGWCWRFNFQSHLYLSYSSIGFVKAKYPRISWHVFSSVSAVWVVSISELQLQSGTERTLTGLASDNEFFQQKWRQPGWLRELCAFMRALHPSLQTADSARRCPMNVGLSVFTDCDLLLSCRPKLIMCSLHKSEIDRCWPVYLCKLTRRFRLNLHK